MRPVRSPLPSVNVPDPEPVTPTFAEANAHPPRSALPDPLICSNRAPPYTLHQRDGQLRSAGRV